MIFGAVIARLSLGRLVNLDTAIDMIDDPNSRQASTDGRRRPKATPEQVKRNKDARKARYRNAGIPVGGFSRRPWTAKEKKLVIGWKGSDIELSRKICRSRTCIQIQRTRLLKARTKE